ncbi:MAG: glycosyltransferase family 1 protein [Acidobacteria bacterium]|nr:glycosyltransferase family 1 protein [Acidobacteriota bacterium]
MERTNFDKQHFDVICFSHLRWDFVYQRPQHLMSRFAKGHRVFVFEEPVFADEPGHLDISRRSDDLFVAVPHLQHGTTADEIPRQQRAFLEGLINERNIENYLAWYYTPMMLEFSRGLHPMAVIYDCMDQLSAFKDAPPELIDREKELLRVADLVFTGGQSLYEAKRGSHPAVYAFPSSIDVPHFAKALSAAEDPADMASIPHPRIGYVGVIDERMDLGLLGEIAAKKPEWHFVMIGPVVKIDENGLPRRSNIHYLGGKDYKELPNYIGRWDVAMMPFAINESTRYISPTKTPEYLAAGRPVVSTPIRDVVHPYGEQGLVYIAATADEFIKGIQAALDGGPEERKEKADAFLSNMSWDRTYAEMSRLIGAAIETRQTGAALSAKTAGYS